MPQYLYQVAYTSESLAQIKNPQDRLELLGKQIAAAVGANRCMAAETTDMSGSPAPMG